MISSGFGRKQNPGYRLCKQYLFNSPAQRGGGRGEELNYQLTNAGLALAALELQRQLGHRGKLLSVAGLLG